MAKKLNTSAATARFAQVKEEIAKEQQSVERTEIIPIDSIIINKDNIFGIDDTEESIAELASNIAANGMIHNILVAQIEPDKYMLVSGERRLKATKYLGRDKIKATIRCGLSELEILKLLFFANSETREYTTEQKIMIIEEFKAKLERFETTSEKAAAAEFKEYVSKVFGINARQAAKLISISEELSEPLKELLFNDLIDINTAAALAQLPAEYQEYAATIIRQSLPADGEEIDAETKKYAIEQALKFAQQAKNIISKTNTSLTKDRTSESYHKARLNNAKTVLDEINAQLESADTNEEAKAELTEKKAEAEATVSKYESKLEQLSKDIDVVVQKQHNEVRKIFDNSVYTVEKGPDDVQKDKSGKIAQTKKISKEVQNIDTAVKKLLDMNPSEELKAIQELLEKYKATYTAKS